MRAVPPSARLAMQAASVAAALAMLHPTGAHAAARCGDDVDGRRVPCACGDIVVSDTVLRPGDPILARPCPVDGLLVAAAPLAETLTLDLGGNVLRGSGTGMGIRVDSGGADGAAIVGGPAGTRATITGFATGIVAGRASVLRRIERVTVSSSRRDGITLRTNGALLVDVEVSDNARDGVRQTGRGGRMVGIVANRNGDTGVRVLGGGTLVSGRCEDNRQHGLFGDGPAFEIRDLVARGNGGRGVLLQGVRSRVHGLVSEGNRQEDRLPSPGGTS